MISTFVVLAAIISGSAPHNKASIVPVDIIAQFLVAFYFYRSQHQRSDQDTLILCNP